jgi:glycosyl transferase, family 25
MSKEKNNPHMNNQIIEDDIYIIHALKGYEYHEKRIRNLFFENNLSFRLITEGDPLFFEKTLLEKYFTDNIREILSDGVLSCTLNHIIAYEKIVQKKQPFAIVMENDPHFLSDFKQDISNIIEEVSQLDGGFIISLDNSTLRFPSYWQSQKNKYLYQANTGRMAGAYLINLEAASAILHDLKTTKCHTVIDWWHNSLFQRQIVKSFWAHPPFVEQCSHNGLLNATISSKQKGVIRQIKWNIQKNYKYYFRRLFNEKSIIQ